MEFSAPNNDILNDFLNEMKVSNPRVKLILDYLEKIKSNNNEMLENKIKHLEERNAHLEERNARLLSSYKVLIKRNEIFSSALGMCLRCWGSDSYCDCEGKGGPGSRMPDKNAFDELVLPVLKKMGIATSETPT
jgi:hypothetical protein